MKGFKIVVMDGSRGISDSEITIETLPNDGFVPSVGDRITTRKIGATVTERGIDYEEKQINLFVGDVDYW